ncbi:MAG: TldD/PmbA family protein [Alphaproteobacteria bacterium]
MPSPAAVKDTAADLLSDVLARARKMGAEAADALVVESASLSAAQRLGKRERLERAESIELGLRVFKGKRQAVVSSTDMSARARADLAERALAMAGTVPEDPDCGLADPDQIARGVPDLDTCDPGEPSADVLASLAAALEEAARAVEGVTNSEGAEASWSRTHIHMAATNGFNGSYTITRHSVIVAVLAGTGTNMERDYEYASAVYGADLEPPEALGRRAGENAVRRLNPRKMKTVKVPVVFDPRVANTLLGHFAGAVNGSAIARGTSFLKDKMDKPVFGRGMRVVDDPLRRRGLRSRPFDGEGVATARRALVEDGVLKSWILDLHSARKLKLATTGHAARGISSPPSPSASNLYLEPGEVAPAELMADIRSGFYVTELMGFGLNPVTGDYSRGATGFWIENGEIAYPVSEVTVAGNAKDMLRNLRPANDLKFRFGTDSPTVRIDGLTVAGR